MALQRAQRLVPAALVCATITAVVMTAIGWYAAGEAFRLWWHSVLFLQGHTIDGSYWTLPVEVAFYGVVSLLLLVGREQWLTGVMMAFTAAGGVFWYLHAHLGNLGSHRDEVSLRLIALEWNSHRLVLYGSSFAVGIYLWRWASGTRSFWTVVGIGTAVAVTLEELPLRAFEISQAFYLRGGLHTGQVLWLLAVCWIAYSRKMDGYLRGKLGAQGVQWVRRLGVATYPLYLVHHFVGYTVEVQLRRVLPPWPAMLLAAGTMVCVALAVSQWAEPAVRWAMFEWPAQVWAGRRGWLGWGSAVPSYGELLNPPRDPQTAVSAAPPLGQEHASVIRQ